MARYALTKDGVTIAEVRFFDVPPEDPVGKGWHWLPLTLTDPPFDPSTQIRTGPMDTVVVAGNSATRVFQVRDMTAQELDDAAMQDAGLDDDEIMRAAFMAVLHLSNAYASALLTLINMERTARGVVTISETTLRQNLDPTSDIVTFAQFKNYVAESIKQERN